MKVSYDDYSEAAAEQVARISDELDRQFGRIGRHGAGSIVDIDFEVSRRTGTIGIRMDNNFGVVTGPEAVKFADAQAVAARMASNFRYLGCELED